MSTRTWTMRKPSVNTNPDANRHSLPNERIIEFSSEGGGGLISFRIEADGALFVHVFRQDDNVQVSFAEA